MKNSMMKVAEIEGTKEEPKVNFKLIPMDKDCPYLEVRFSLEYKRLMLIHSNRYETFQMMPRLDDNGLAMSMKPVKGSDGQTQKAKYERLRVTNYYDYTITDRSDIEKIVNHLTGETNNLDEYFKIEEKPKDPTSAEDDKSGK